MPNDRFPAGRMAIAVGAAGELGRSTSVKPHPLLDTGRARAEFPKEVLAHAVAPEAIAEVVAFLVSEAAAPISGAILPTYGA